MPVYDGVNAGGKSVHLSPHSAFDMQTLTLSFATKYLATANRNRFLSSPTPVTSTMSHLVKKTHLEPQTTLHAHLVKQEWPSQHTNTPRSQSSTTSTRTVTSTCPGCSHTFPFLINGRREAIRRRSKGSRKTSTKLKINGTGLQSAARSSTRSVASHQRSWLSVAWLVWA